jgi:hypothetical protein
MNFFKIKDIISPYVIVIQKNALAWIHLVLINVGIARATWTLKVLFGMVSKRLVASDR